MKKILELLPSFLKNFYFLSTLFFLVWVAFLDSNDLFMQLQLSSKKSQLIDQKEFYQEKILQVKNDQAALNSNPELLEKMAREKYLMKKEGEDLFVIVRSKE